MRVIKLRPGPFVEHIRIQAPGFQQGNAALPLQSLDLQSGKLGRKGRLA